MSACAKVLVGQAGQRRNPKCGQGQIKYTYYIKTLKREKRCKKIRSHLTESQDSFPKEPLADAVLAQNLFDTPNNLVRVQVGEVVKLETLLLLLLLTGNNVIVIVIDWKDCYWNLLI